MHQEVQFQDLIMNYFFLTQDSALLSAAVKPALLDSNIV